MKVQKLIEILTFLKDDESIGDLEVMFAFDSAVRGTIDYISIEDYTNYLTDIQSKVICLSYDLSDIDGKIIIK